VQGEGERKGHTGTFFSTSSPECQSLAISIND